MFSTKAQSTESRPLSAEEIDFVAGGKLKVLSVNGMTVKGPSPGFSATTSGQDAIAGAGTIGSSGVFAFAASSGTGSASASGQE